MSRSILNHMYRIATNLHNSTIVKQDYLDVFWCIFPYSCIGKKLSKISCNLSCYGVLNSANSDKVPEKQEICIGYAWIEIVLELPLQTEFTKPARRDQGTKWNPYRPNKKTEPERRPLHTCLQVKTNICLGVMSCKSQRSSQNLQEEIPSPDAPINQASRSHKLARVSFFLWIACCTCASLTIQKWLKN